MTATEKISIEKLVNLYLKSYVYQELKENTKRGYLQYLNLFCSHFGTCDITMLEQRIIYRQITDLIENIALEKKPTARYFQSVIKVFIKWAYHKGYTQINHAELVCVKIERSRKIDNVWKAEQIEQVMKIASPEFKDLIFFLSETGLRQSDAIRIKISEHLKRRPDGNLFFFIQQKKSRDVIPPRAC